MQNGQLRWLLVAGCVLPLACEPPGAAQSTTGSAPSSNTSSSTTSGSIGIGGSGCFSEDGSGGGDSFALTVAGPVTTPERRSPPLGGGGLLVSRDGTRAVVSDADRDRVFVATLGESPALALDAEIPLQMGDEPGRAVEDASGVVHIVLRGSGQLVSLDLVTAELRARRAVCDQPRGIAYNAKLDVLHVACAEGRLVTLPAAPSEPALREWRLDDDLRDVVVQGDELVVSRFRSAELLRVNSVGAVVARVKPPRIQLWQEEVGCAGATNTREFEPLVAWRMAPVSDDTVLVLHQRAEATPLELEEPSAYGGGSVCPGIVQSVVTMIGATGAQRVMPGVVSATLATDVALSPDGAHVALTASTTDAGTRALVLVGRALLESSSSASTFVSDSSTLCNDIATLVPGDQPTAVAFTPDGRLLVFSRQPALLSLVDVATPDLPVARVYLNDVDVTDTGQEIFHGVAGNQIACASCHPEAGDDGHVWSFTGVGARRTQHLRGGILGTAPFHWEGDLPSFQHLMSEVMERRMAGPILVSEYQAALANWIDAQPAFSRTDYDVAAAERGRLLFESDETRCATCHSGEALTNNATVNVGTGLGLQVPSLRGVSFRAPFLHDGCAPTLRDRFGSCGGGDAHGVTSQLGTAQVSDLVEYMKSL